MCARFCCSPCVSRAHAGPAFGGRAVHGVAAAATCYENTHSIIPVHLPHPLLMLCCSLCVCGSMLLMLQEGWNVAHVAAKWGYHDCLQLAIDAGADVNAKSKVGARMCARFCCSPCVSRVHAGPAFDGRAVHGVAAAATCHENTHSVTPVHLPNPLFCCSAAHCVYMWFHAAGAVHGSRLKGGMSHMWLLSGVITTVCGW